QRQTKISRRQANSARVQFLFPCSDMRPRRQSLGAAMHIQASTIAGLTAACALALAAFGSGFAATPVLRPLAQKTGGVAVDVELVLAVDVSFSMDPDEQDLQREGYIQALTSREFMQALRQGTHGRIALTYFEWAGENDQKIVVPWRLIDGPESADGVAAEIARAP